MNTKPKIGWIGTGIMGLPMAMHLLDAGYQMTVYNRTRSKSSQILAKGAIWADSPAMLAKNSDMIFSIVSHPRDVEEVILGDSGCLGTLRKGGIICDMTTSTPDLARKIAMIAKEKGCMAIDAPITGGETGAREGSLSFFVGCDKEAYKIIAPCLKCMGKNILYCGGHGNGQAAKLANQISVAGIMFSVCESMLFAREEGLDVEKWLEFVSVHVAQSQTMKKRGERILANDFKPGFYVEYFIKDLRLCIEECRRMNLVLPGTELAEELYSGIAARGGGKSGTQALIEALAELSGKKWNQHF